MTNQNAAAMFETVVSAGKITFKSENAILIINV